MTTLDDRIDRVIAWSLDVDRQVALGGIEHKANWLRDDAVGLQGYLKMLDRLPEWDTKAEAAVADAEAALTETLLAVKLARRELETKKPVVIPVIPYQQET